MHEAHMNARWPCNNVHLGQRRSTSYPDDLAGLLWLAQTSLPGLFKQAASGSFRDSPAQLLWCCNTNPNNNRFFRVVFSCQLLRCRLRWQKGERSRRDSRIEHRIGKSSNNGMAVAVTAVSRPSWQLWRGQAASWLTAEEAGLDSLSAVRVIEEVGRSRKMVRKDGDKMLKEPGKKNCRPYSKGSLSISRQKSHTLGPALGQGLVLKGKKSWLLRPSYSTGYCLEATTPATKKGWGTLTSLDAHNSCNTWRAKGPHLRPQEACTVVDKKCLAKD